SRAAPDAAGPRPARPPSARLRRAEDAFEARLAGAGGSPGPRRLRVRMLPPTADDNVSDLDRLLRSMKADHGIAHPAVDPVAVAEIPAAARKGGWDVTATVAFSRVRSTIEDPDSRTPRRPRLIHVQPGDRSALHHAVVFDIGTTSVWAELLDLAAGRVLAQASDYNGQIPFGADVIARIIHSGRPGGLRHLQEAVVATMNRLIADLFRSTGAEPGDVSHAVAAGNPTMTHLLAGVDPGAIRIPPYTPATRFFPPVRARLLGLDFPDHVHLQMFPTVSSWVGGDIVSGVLAHGFFGEPRVTLFVDIGTNAEVVVGNSEFLLTASCSAGSAFEGAGIRCGMRAVPGAVEDVGVDPATGEPMIVTVGRRRPEGICGSGLIHGLAELFLAGVLDPNGKFAPGAAPARVRERGGLREYVLVRAEDSATGADITIDEADVDNLMRAKGAIHAGIRTLLAEAGLGVRDIDRVVLAGAFGTCIDIDKAIAIGLLPDLPRDRFVFLGNGSLLGARLAALDGAMIDQGERVARRMTALELSETPRFMDEYVAALFLPHTDAASFPSVASRR
ncbi:MAG: ASKHA domain-containing protein, partial [Myxococcota bacterium]|nr:ASKHA domain-containing protein [Myxococcota bacterium]